MGSHTRRGTRLSGSGLRAIRKRGRSSTCPCSVRCGIGSSGQCLAVLLGEQSSQVHTPSHRARTGDERTEPVVAAISSIVLLRCK